MELKLTLPPINPIILSRTRKTDFRPVYHVEQLTFIDYYNIHQTVRKYQRALYEKSLATRTEIKPEDKFVHMEKEQENSEIHEIKRKMYQSLLNREGFYLYKNFGEFFEPLDLNDVPENRKPVEGLEILPFRYHFGNVCVETEHTGKFGSEIDPELKKFIEINFPEKIKVMKDWCRPLASTDATFADFNKPTKQIRPNPEFRTQRIIKHIHRIFDTKPFRPLSFYDVPFVNLPLNTGTSYFYRHSHLAQAHVKYSSPEEFKNKPTLKGHMYNFHFPYAMTIIHNMKDTGVPIKVRHGPQHTQAEYDEAIVELQRFYLQHPAMLHTRSPRTINNTDFAAFTNFLVAPAALNTRHNMPVLGAQLQALYQMRNTAHVAANLPYTYARFNEATSVYPNVAVYQPFKTDPNSIAHALILGLKIEQDTIDGITIPLPQPENEPYENNSNFHQGAIPIAKIMPVIMNNDAANAIRVVKRDLHPVLAHPIGFALRDMSQSIVPVFNTLEIQAHCTIRGLVNELHHTTPAHAFTATAWNSDATCTIPDSQIYLWSSYRYIKGINHRNRVVYFYCTLSGIFGTSIPISRIQNPALAITGS
jgi:hypothetical protein